MNQFQHDGGLGAGIARVRRLFFGDVPRINRVGIFAAPDINQIWRTLRCGNFNPVCCEADGLEAVMGLHMHYEELLDFAKQNRQ